MLGLAFSGGKDSLACWYLFREHQPVVFWVNTGKIYPETMELVQEVRQEALNFVEINTNQEKQNQEVGVPSDLVPVDWTVEGINFTTHKQNKVQSYLRCCAENLSAPLHRMVKQHGITHLIRGQRADESHRSTAVNGSVYDGIMYLHPIETWTSQQVLDFIMAKRGSLPLHFNIKHSSLDCYDCTAYVAHSADRVVWMKHKHPDLHAKYEIRLTQLRLALAETMRLYH